jgi:hypothetical protein
MRPLKRVTRQVTGQSNLLLNASLQVNGALKAGEIRPETAEEFMAILKRMHGKLLIDAGIYDRRRMARYEQRQKQLARRRRCQRTRAANLTMAGCVFIAFVHIAIDTWL